jgi:hypothetical protein
MLSGRKQKYELTLHAVRYVGLAELIYRHAMGEDHSEAFAVALTTWKHKNGVGRASN